jgi:hypothetical protein
VARCAAIRTASTEDVIGEILVIGTAGYFVITAVRCELIRA